jgi:succinate dehydrogenase (ubiquinone) iron-sulfur subunit
MFLRNFKSLKTFNKINSFRITNELHTQTDKYSKLPEKFGGVKKTKEYDHSLQHHEKENMKKFTIFRYDPEHPEGKHFVSYYIDLKDCGPMVLDALIKVKDEIDPTLSFRRSCREGICGSCSMSIDGRNTLACLSYIDTDVTRESTISPLPYFLVMRDLVVDMTNFYTQYKAIQPVLMRKSKKVI